MHVYTRVRRTGLVCTAVVLFGLKWLLRGVFGLEAYVVGHVPCACHSGLGTPALAAVGDHTVWMQTISSGRCATG